MDLFIPSKINNDNRFSTGIGSKEFKQIIKGGFVGLLLGVIIGFVFFKTIRATLISMVVSGLLLAVLTYFIVLKNADNLSVYIFIGIIKRYIKEQKYYQYKKLKECFNVQL